MVAVRVGATRQRSGDSKRVLIVDDDPDLTWMMSDLLAMIGHEVRAANSATDALAIARELRPQVAFVDLHGTGGGELARRLRAQADGPIEIIAISGRHLSPEEAPAFDGAFLKPVGLAELVQALERT